MKGFVNPYNFIDFPTKRAKAYKDTDLHTGVIKYTITTKMPLFIPNSSSETAFAISDKKPEHKSYDFFSYTELDCNSRYDGIYHTPVIPGSEIRGVIRNIYETLTDSCMGVLNDGVYPVKRSATRFTPALIHKQSDGTMELLEAGSLRIGQKADKGKLPKGFESYHNGTKLYYECNKPNGIINLDSVSMDSGKGKEGYLIKWGMGVKKARYHVFTPKKNSNSKWHNKILTKDVIERKLKPVIESYLSQPRLDAGNKRAYEEYQNDLKQFLNGKGEACFPVTCTSTGESGDGIYYLAPAIFSKEVSDNNIGQLAGQFKPCDSDYCPACELFGHVGRDNENSKGSKLRFSDMYVKEKREAMDYYAVDSVTIPSLAEPKLGNTEFYLKRSNGADFWTYDYFTKDGKTYVEKGKLRGRKYYWHHNENVCQNIIENKNIKPTKLNKTIRPVKAGISFTGKLYFDGVSNNQIKQLIWILNSQSHNIAYKLGGAKPYGLGSVVCSVDSVSERKIEWKDNILSYSNGYDAENTCDENIIDENCTYEDAGFSASVKDAFMKISALDRVPESVEITYPKTEEQKDEPLSEGYKWFMNNHATRSNRGMPEKREDIVIKKVLPEISQEDFSLEYNKSEKNNSGRPNSRPNYSNKLKNNNRNNSSKYKNAANSKCKTR